MKHEFYVQCLECNEDELSFIGEQAHEHGPILVFNCNVCHKNTYIAMVIACDDERRSAEKYYYAN